MSTLDIQTPRVFLPLLQPSRYKGVWGGRGSGKSNFFAETAVEKCLLEPGARILCVREIQKSLKQSAKQLIEDKIAAFGVGSQFDIQRDLIRTPGGGLIAFAGMQDHTAESVKSLEGFDVAWVEEAQALSAHSMRLLRPTIRKPGSELWFSWNPRRKTDPVDQLLRADKLPPGAIVVKANWSDNPWFPAELDAERRFDLERSPESYDHVWEGGYAKVTEGAYFAAQLTAARREGRIGKVARDDLMTVRAVWDIGGTGAKADATAIWIVQFIAREIRVLDYYEAVGQPLSAHVAWLRERGYGKALCVLPHDGVQGDKVVDTSYQRALDQAGFDVTVIPNQGKGAASQRIEAVRRRFPLIWFNEATCEAGLEALSCYHERKDEARNIGLGPEHDWASHAADAFGLVCLTYQEPQSTVEVIEMPNYAGWG